MSKEIPSPGERVAQAGLVLALLIGAAACMPNEKRTATHATSPPGPTPSATAAPTPVCALALELFSVDRNTASGSAYATNEGECVHVFGPEIADTSGAVGQIPAGGTFFIDCYDLAASSLRVTIKGAKGLLDMTDTACQHLNDDPAAQRIPSCS